MAYNSGVFDSLIRLAMENQSVIEGKQVTRDDLIVIALHDLMVKQEKVIGKHCVKICK